jgi:hypothetical protein
LQEQNRRVAMVMAFAKLLLTFAPWLSFLLIAHGTPIRVKVGLVVAFLLSIAMGIARLHRGVILWVGLVFFGSATLAVGVFENLWTLRHIGVLANGALAAGSWLTIAVRKPFTLDYAKEHTAPALWDSPVFLKTNDVVTAAWAMTFTINCGLALLKVSHFIFADLTFELVSYALLIGAAFFTVWYPAHLPK